MSGKQRKNMELNPREAAFLKSEMGKIEEDKTRQPTARKEAEQIQKKAKREITE